MLPTSASSRRGCKLRNVFEITNRNGIRMLRRLPVHGPLGNASGMIQRYILKIERGAQRPRTRRALSRFITGACDAPQ